MKRRMKAPKILILMGVTCSGKTAFGKMLSNRLKISFFDGDDLHSKENIDKMKLGHPLDDDDRWPWLQNIHQLALDHANEGAIIACSALKKSYRQVIQTSANMEFIYLKAAKKSFYAPLTPRFSIRSSGSTPKGMYTRRHPIV